MGFAAGALKRLIQGKKETTDGFTVAGDLFEDKNGKRGWIVQIVAANGVLNYSVVDGEIHRSGISEAITREDQTVITTQRNEASLRDAAEKALLSSIAKWEKEETEEPRT